MRNQSRNSHRADARLVISSVWPREMVRVAQTAFVMTGLALAPLVHRPLCAQTYVQVAEVDPNSPIGSRITSTVTNLSCQGAHCSDG
jgi:hypothetical protein